MPKKVRYKKQLIFTHAYVIEGWDGLCDIFIDGIFDPDDYRSALRTAKKHSLSMPTNGYRIVEYIPNYETIVYVKKGKVLNANASN